MIKDSHEMNQKREGHVCTYGGIANCDLLNNESKVWDVLQRKCNHRPRNRYCGIILHSVFLSKYQVICWTVQDGN